MGHINAVAGSAALALALAHKPWSGSAHNRGRPRMTALVRIIMGSDSDLPTMRAAATMLDELGVSFEIDIVSATARRTNCMSTPVPPKRVACGSSSPGQGRRSPAGHGPRR